MIMPFPGRSAPSAGFEVPLEMLAACHHRVASQCQTLRRLVKHLATNEIDEDARVAATAVLRYFDTAAKDHHADEESDLFPALLESVPGSDPICIRELIEALLAEHRAIEVQWRCLRPKLVAIAAGEGLGLEDADVNPLIALYEQHIAREETELLPMAARLLSDSTLDDIGRAMRVRRGLGDDE